MTFKTLTCAAALALTAALPTQAATFNIAFDQASNGVGADVIGSFEAPAEGGAVTNFTVTIDGKTYDTAYFQAQHPISFNAIDGSLTSTYYGLAYFTEDPQGANGMTQSAIGLGFYGVFDPMTMKKGAPSLHWFVNGCINGECVELRAQGTYAVTALPQPPVSAVPLPAGLPLLAAGLGVLGLMRRRKA